jgi:hypothetical protein
MKKIQQNKLSPEEYSGLNMMDVQTIANRMYNQDLPIIQRSIDRQKNYKKKTEIMKNEEIYNQWTEFIKKYNKFL